MAKATVRATRLANGKLLTPVKADGPGRRPANAQPGAQSACFPRSRSYNDAMSGVSVTCHLAPQKTRVEIVG